jgi:TM2 domain-containing membrane protein YozV
MKCPKCQTENQQDSKYCINCGGALPTKDIISPPPPPPPPPPKDPNLAAILSVIPGFGQFYNGDVKKGVVMLVGVWILRSTDIGLIFIVIWVWSAIDAYQVAKGNLSLWK